MKVNLTSNCRVMQDSCLRPTLDMLNDVSDLPRLTVGQVIVSWTHNTTSPASLKVVSSTMATIGRASPWYMRCLIEPGDAQF
jgi:hypothetical protein